MKKYTVLLSKPKTNFACVVCETNNINDAQRRKKQLDEEFAKQGYFCDILEQTDYYELILKALNKKE